MKLSSKLLAIIVVVLLFGGIALSDQMGMWQTESSKQAAVFSEGEFVGMPDPADIRGSYTFGDIEKNFEVPAGILAEAFDVPPEKAESFPVKELESIYEDSTVEIGTASVRLFVAFYTGLPYDLTMEETYLPQSAADILQSRTLSEERLLYLDNYTFIPVETENSNAEPTQPVVSPTVENSDRLVKGKTTFAEILAWGVSQETLAQVLGLPLPDDTQTIVKDFAATNGLDFETIKTNLQMEVDKAE